jgi:predicted DNA-binding transcriptional regulator YafY
MNRVDRLLAMIVLLQSRRVVTAREIADHFELSERTVYRDLAALGEAGVPIVAEAGVGYTLMRGYHLPPVNFTTEEAYALVTGGLLVEQFTDASVKAQMHSALLKVRAVLPRNHQDRIARLERGLATTANVPAPTQADLSILQQALTNLRLLRFDYQTGGRPGTTQRTAEPCGLIHYLERWHLIAWCRNAGAYRDFRTDRMTNVTLLSETFTPREEFSVAQYIRSMPRPDLRARVQFSPAAADRAKREWWMGIIDEEPVTNGVVLTLASVDWQSLVRWLLSFGCEVIALEPESLREALVAAAAEAGAHHAKKPRAKVS